MRAVPHVGSHRAPRAPGPRACSQARRAGPPVGRDRVHLGAGRELAPAGVVVAAGERGGGRRRRARRGPSRARRCRRRRRPGARERRRRRGAPARAAVYEAAQRSPVRPEHDRLVRRPRRVASAERCPRELGRRALARAPRARAQLVVVEQRVRARRCTPRRRRAGTAAPASPTTSSSAEPSRDGERRAARERLERREAEASYRDAMQHAAARRMSASTTGHGCSPSTRTNGRSSPRPSPQPGGPTTTSSRSVAPRGARRSTASTIVGRSLRGSTVPTVSTYGASTPALRDRGVDLGVGARRRRVDAEQRDLHVFGAEALRGSSSTRVNDDGAITRSACRRATSSARRWKRDAAPRRDVRDAEERDVVHGHDERASRTGGTARLGACTTSASMRSARPAEPVPAARSARCRAARRDRSTGRRRGTPGGRAPAANATASTPTRREHAQQRVRVAADAARAPAAGAARRAARPSSCRAPRASR